MARLARVVAVDIAHHVTQRANARRLILESDSDKLVYVDLLRQHCTLYELLLLGYCLMSNHVHLVVIPRKIESLAATMKNAHGRYATYWNASHSSSGHAWQGRYYSCPLDLTHLWRALRYTELNPVRARMVSTPEVYRWSSAGAHCGVGQSDLALDTELWSKQWNFKTWQEYLREPGAEADAETIRRGTHTGRPLGSEDFVKTLEKTVDRVLAPHKGGRPSKLPNRNQEIFNFD